ncbi:MAG TPA: helix-turn-helix domain-containing protein [Oscillospiraceae bacterium]|nr:helix-turn-helix domain-containing protein [Oscillospiraceae bacterium]
MCYHLKQTSVLVIFGGLIVFSFRLKELRKSAGISQIDFAKIFNISNGTIAMWETEKRTPDTDTLIKISKYFGVTVDYLLGKTNFKNGMENYTRFCNTIDPDFDDSFDFGPLCKEIRENQGHTLKEMSEALGLTESDLEDIEAGVLPINEYWAKKIVDFLDTTVSQVLFDNDLYNGDVPDEYYDRVDDWEKLAKQNHEEAVSEFYINGELHHNAPITYEEESMLLKYHALDDHGKNLIDTVLKLETERCSCLSETAEEIQPKIRVKFIDLPVSAGFGADLLYDGDIKYMCIPDTPTARKADFALRISGDSMEPKFSDGDVVLVKEQSAVDKGEIGIFIVNTTGYIKKYNGKWLESLNPKYPDIKPADSDDVRCAGIVVGKM